MSPSGTTRYSDLFRLPGYPRVAIGVALARIGTQMAAVALVLFVLQRYGSSQLAGAVIFLSIFPGLLVSPLAGALLDRAGRARLMMLDFIVGAAALGLLVLLSTLHVLPPWLLLLITGVASLTGPLSNAGARSLLPTLVPRRLWDRSNALDSMGWTLASIAGPGLAGLAVAVAGGEGALLLTAALMLSSAVAVSGIRDPASQEVRAKQGLIADARAGLRYVLTNPSLRGLAVSLSILNIGGGLIMVAMPVLMLRVYHQGAGMVGLMWALNGVAATASVLVAGRLSTEGRERPLMVITAVLFGFATMFMALPLGVPGVMASMILSGLTIGPFDVAMFSLRQRRTEPAWYGRAFAVSMSLNYSGVPLGSLIGGPAVVWSLPATIVGAGFAALLAGFTTRVMVPRLAPPHGRGLPSVSVSESGLAAGGAREEIG